MLRYVLTVILMLALLAGWVAVRELARRFARRHPEFGEYRERGGGCCRTCAGEASCSRKDRDRND